MSTFNRLDYCSNYNNKTANNNYDNSNYLVVDSDSSGYATADDAHQTQTYATTSYNDDSTTDVVDSDSTTDSTNDSTNDSTTDSTTNCIIHVVVDSVPTDNDGPDDATNNDCTGREQLRHRTILSSSGRLRRIRKVCWRQTEEEQVLSWTALERGRNALRLARKSQVRCGWTR